MSFYKKTIFLITTAIMVSSCNLKPIYQSDLKDRPLENKVSVENIDTDIGFYLAQNLRFALNDFGSKKRLNLITEIEISENKYSFSSSNTETRMDLIGLIHCKIIDNDHEYKFTFLKHELRFNGAKLDSKVYSISNLSLYPHSDMYKEVVIFEDGRELVIPLKVNSLDPLRNSALLRLRSNKSQLKIYLR